MESSMNTLTNVNSLSGYITINGIVPVNSEDEEEHEQVPIQDSDNIDSLTLNIHEKLKIIPGISSPNRRRKNHPYSHIHPMNFIHHNESRGKSGTASANNEEYNRFSRRFPGSIGKSNSHLFTLQRPSSVTKRRSSRSITKQFSRTDDPCQLLQELLESGSLIKEAVRRVNRKRLNFDNGNSTNIESVTSSDSMPMLSGDGSSVTN